VRVVDPYQPQVEGLDVLIADPSALGGHVLSLLHGIRQRALGLKLVLSYVYCDATQAIEQEMHELADVCVLKPCDLSKLESTLRHLVRNDLGTGSEAKPSS
jgi:DNA-binding NtrC family response regulator